MKEFGTDAFWAKFSRDTWEKKTATYKNVGHEILSLDAESIFEILLHYCDQCRVSETTEGLKFYVNGIRLESFEAIEHLPVATDKSLLGYHRRMNRQFRDYGLVCDELMQVPDAKWDLVAHFLQGLYKHVGLPNRFTEVGLYLGNYRKTPFGVHVDRCGVLSLPIVGAKTFRLWTPGQVEKNPELKEAFSYEEFKKRSIVLKAKPGDITYWPSSHWHIAESDGTFSATWSLGFWVDRPLEDVVNDVFAPLVKHDLQRALGDRAKRTSLMLPSRAKQDDGQRAALPQDLERAVKILARSSKNEWHDAFSIWWLEQNSRRGFRGEKNRAPISRRRMLRDGDILTGRPDHTIFWSKLFNRKIAWAFDGKSFQSKAATRAQSLATEKILRDFNAGLPVMISKKLSKPSRTLLQELFDHDAVDSVNKSSRSR